MRERWRERDAGPYTGEGEGSRGFDQTPPDEMMTWLWLRLRTHKIPIHILFHVCLSLVLVILLLVSPLK